MKFYRFLGQEGRIGSSAGSRPSICTNKCCV